MILDFLSLGMCPNSGHATLIQISLKEHYDREIISVSQETVWETVIIITGYFTGTVSPISGGVSVVFDISAPDGAIRGLKLLAS